MPHISVQRRAAQLAVPRQLSERALLAAHIAQTASTPLAVLQRADAGQAIINISLATDLDFCAAVDVSRIVPYVLPATGDATMMVGFMTIE